MDEIINIGVENLNKLKEAHKLDYYKLKDFPGDYSHGLGYAGKGIAEFDSFLLTAKKIVQQSEIETIPKRASELMNLLRSSPHKFLEKLDFQKAENLEFTLAPVFAKIDAKEFTEVLFNLSNSNKINVSSQIESRYTYGYNSTLENEFAWLKEVIALIDNKSKELSDSVSTYVIVNRVLPAFKRCLKSFINHQDDI